MNPHRVEVFDRAHNNAVIGAITHDFHLEFLPTEQRLFDEQFAGRRGFEAATADGFEFFGVIGNATAGSAEREARTNDRGKAAGANGFSDLTLHSPSFFHAVRNA